MKVIARTGLRGDWLLAWLCLGPVPLFGQVGISLSTEFQKYLRYEPIVARVLLRNNSGNMLAFGDSIDGNGGYLRFSVVRGEELQEAPPFDNTLNPVADLILGAGETKQLEVTLNTLYDMQAEGTYNVTATIGHRRLRHDYRCESAAVQVRGGIVLWSQELGIPAGDTAESIQSRTAHLLLFNSDDGDMYCLQVEDEELVYGVVRLGPRISGAKPECDVDAISNVHVLCQIRSRLYAYRVYDYNIVRKESKYFRSKDTIPHLHRDPDVHRVMVVGGTRAVEGVDFKLVGSTSGEPAWPGRGSFPAGELLHPSGDGSAESTQRRKEGGRFRSFLNLFKRDD